MSNHSGSSGQAADVFTKFWTDAMSRAGAVGGTMFGASREEASKQMRQAFFDAWERQCEEYMKSEAFLKAMKQSMDNALTFREQMNQFLTTALRTYQMPSQDDTDSILLAVRRLEERVLKRVDDLSRRVEAMETRGRESIDTGAREKRTTKGGSK